MSNKMFDQWGLYARILASNYMRHRDLSVVVREFLAGLDRSCRVLDLGCGDGWMTRECLKSSRVSRYVAIDTSTDAIARVRACPPAGSEPDNARIDLYCEDVFTALSELLAGKFDLVLSSYCLHHFPSRRNWLFYARSVGCSLRMEASSGATWQGAASRPAICTWIR